MSQRRMTIGLLLACLLLLAACSEFKLPEERELSRVYTGRERNIGIEPLAPDDVPELAMSELADWRYLCDQCHVGPNYSSHTILEWGHRDSCLSGLACLDCHSDKLHKTHIRGDKSQCFECHLSRDLHYNCDNCHVVGWSEEHPKHDQAFLNDHGQFADWEGLSCEVCHGRNYWCYDCHGIEMPHPAEIKEMHAELVRGNPQACANCHGRQVCETCHEREGVSLTEPLPYP